MLYKVRMHIITIYVTFLKLKKTAFNDFKEELELEKKEKKIKILRKAIIFGGRACFGWVGRSTANQHFLRSAYFDCSSTRFAQSIKKHQHLVLNVLTANVLTRLRIRCSHIQ